MSTSWGFNVNLLNHDCHNDTDQFINTMYSYSFLPLITRPTRFTSTSATLIANIMTNVFNDSIVSGILISDVSVHLPVFYVSNDTVIDNFTSAVKSYGHICEKNITLFREELINTQ